ncbi:MAG TPA: pyridoxal-phosphate dependent enzyme, partial [Pseudonocardia sp.]|nr:pyridoxal-phosphate dependent enzyme [Pseudonocardia sp.]
MSGPTGRAALVRRPSERSREVARRTRAFAPALRPHVLRTPLTPLPGTGKAGGPEALTLLTKDEHLQHGGSFKIRGATAKMLSVDAAGRARGVVAASSGNHGLGVAHALRAVGGRGTIFVPEGASPVKVAAITRLGVEVVHRGTDVGDTEAIARAYAARHGLVYVSPYNDLDVIAGQGTIALEMLEQAGRAGLDAVIVAVGGGGLVSGIGATLASEAPHVRVIGAAPAHDAAMAASVAAGRVVDGDALPTISDGTAGGIEPGTVTLPLCAELVDEWVLVDEPEIRAALRHFVDTRHQLVEGAAAVAIAAALR